MQPDNQKDQHLKGFCAEYSCTGVGNNTDSNSNNDIGVLCWAIGLGAWALKPNAQLSTTKICMRLYRGYTGYRGHMRIYLYLYLYICIHTYMYIYIYMLTPPHPLGPTFQCSKIPKFPKNPVNFFGNSKIPKFQKRTDYWNSKKLTGFFWILEFWNFGILESWNFGTLEFSNFGISQKMTG